MCIQDKDHEKKGSVGQDNEVIQVFFFFCTDLFYDIHLLCAMWQKKK
jgi:hypothetical protein